MSSFAGVIGTGLFLGTGGALRSAGPVGLLLGYMIVGTVCYSVMVQYFAILSKSSYSIRLP
jgi:amino acid transporter